MKNQILLELIILNIVLHSSIVNAFNCRLPEGCRIENVYNSKNLYYYNQKEFNSYPEIICDVNENVEFSFKDPVMTTDEKCFTDSYTYFRISYIIFRWTSSNELSILEKRFNFTNLVRYSNFFMPELHISFWGIKGFDVQFLGEIYNMPEKSFSVIALSDCNLNFYHNKKKINSCQHFSDLNITEIRSIFQISFNNASDVSKRIELRNIDYKENICPFVFQNSKITMVLLNDLMDSFYKKNVLTFSNETYPQLNSNIGRVEIHNSYNIELDMKLLHQSVFYNLQRLYIASGSFRSISLEIIKNFNKLIHIRIHPMIFKKINHKQGIEWIRLMNIGLNVNFSKEPSKEDREHFLRKKQIELERIVNNPHISFKELLPDEDFCIYVDFPFNQLVIVTELHLGEVHGTRDFNTELTCTYLWLVQYYRYYLKYLPKMYDFDSLSNMYMINLMNSAAFKSKSKCNFDERIQLCNKSDYQAKDFWDESDFFFLNKKIQIAFKISIYPVSLLGLITNFIVVLVILKKDNNDLFKECKQYNYLYINSIFCIMISVIELLSWMTECFYPFEVFCPEIRKLVAIQFFKIIFKECFVTVFRFMCNFTYIAFSLNRISLLGKDHGKIVTFISEVGIKRYIIVTVLISLLLSWMKFFQYEVNYYYPHLSFPMFNQVSITANSNAFKDVFFIFNVISDLSNYFVFVVISIIIDICMVVQLRRILEEKLKKSQSLNQKQNETKKAEFDEAVNKAIKMVVLNSAIGIFFKLPTCIIPLINVCAEFYYKNHKNLDYNINFNLFFQYLFDSELYSLIQDISNFLFSLSLSIQIFIYYRFDKKFLTGYDRLKDKAFLSIKNRFN